MPFLRDLILEIKAVMRVFQEFTLNIEREFITAETVDDEIVNKIACAKIEISNYCIDAIQRIKKSVGSYSLMEKSPFGTKTDILFVFAFAEGDVSILQQKMSRDLIKKYGSLIGLAKLIASTPITLLKNPNGVGIQASLLKLELASLGLKMANAKRRCTRDDPSPLVNTWLDSHSLVTKISRRKALLTILEGVSETLEGSYEYEVYKRYVVNQV